MDFHRPALVIGITNQSVQAIDRPPNQLNFPLLLPHILPALVNYFSQLNAHLPGASTPVLPLFELPVCL